MKKLTALLMAIITCTSAFSCNSSKDKQPQPENTVAEQMSNVAYKRSLLETPEGFTMLWGMEPYNDGQNFLMLGLSGSGLAFCTTDNTFSKYEAVKMPDFSYLTTYDIDVTNDGTIVQLTNIADYGDLPEPDPYAEDYDAELYENAAEYSLGINRFSIDGKQISSASVSGFPMATDKDTRITGVVSDGESLIAEIDDGYHVFAADGAYKGELKSSDDDYSLMQTGKDREGNLVCVLINFDTEQMKICRVDTEKAVPESTSVTYSFSETVTNQVLEGTGDYSMYLTSRTTIYGIRSDDMSIEPVFSITASGIDSTALSDYYISPDGTVVIPDYGDYTVVKIRRFTPCDPAEIENIPLITVGSFSDVHTIPEHIADLNDSQTEYRVELKIYDDSNGASGYDSALDEFAEDVLSGDLPDVLIISPSYQFGEMNMLDDGILCDLYEFIDNDEEFSRESFVESVMSALEIDGAMYGLPSRFDIDAGYAAKTKFVGDIDEWSYNTYMDVLENMPEGMVSDSMYIDGGETKHTRMSYYMSDYVDFENATCNFDCPEFIRMLKYCDEAPLESDYNYDMSEEEAEKHARECDMAYIEEKAMLSPVGISGYEDLYELRNGTFGGEDVTVLGRPSIKGDKYIFEFDAYSFYGITETSENKEAAWKFIKTLINDEWYEKEKKPGTLISGFPITKNGLEIKAEALLDRQVSNADEPGIGHMYGPEWVNIGLVTQDDIDEINELINSIKARDSISYLPYEASEGIFWEEVFRFFNGECTAEECAEIIQDRMSTFLAERS